MNQVQLNQGRKGEVGGLNCSWLLKDVKQLLQLSTLHPLVLHGGCLMQWNDSIATNKSFAIEWGEGVKMVGLFLVVSLCQPKMYIFI